jgi:hypothetical protein
MALPIFQLVRMKHLCLFFVLFPLFSEAQQVADTLYSPHIEQPAYKIGIGSVVLLDEAHNNFHTLSGRFKPFAKILEKDGYTVLPSSAPFTTDALSKGKILVIANALHASNREQWNLPTPSAFTDEEIEIVNTWVKDGGSLFLIADHMPFPGAAEKLAASFGFKFYNGFAVQRGGKDIFTIDKGLMPSTLTKGRNEKEIVTSLQTFGGQAFEIPGDAVPVIILSEDFEVKIPQAAWQFSKETETVDGKGLAQGAYMNYGKGRLVIFGEAAMFTAQLHGRNKMGMNVKSASQNAQFLLNTIHWLDGIVE